MADKLRRAAAESEGQAARIAALEAQLIEALNAEPDTSQNEEAARIKQVREFTTCHRKPHCLSHARCRDASCAVAGQGLASVLYA